MGDALLDGLALAGELGVEVGDLVDRVDVEQLLEARLESRQVVALQSGEHPLVLRQRGQAHVHLDGLGLELLLEAAHGVDDALGQTGQALVLRVDALLQPLAHLLLPVVAGLDRQLMLAQRLRAPAIQALNLRRGQRQVVPHAAGLIPHRLRCLTLALDLASLAQRVGPLDLQLAKPLLCGLELAPQLLQGVGCGFQPRALLGECRNLAGQAHPVDVRKARELLQLAECIEPAPQFVARLLDLANALPQRGESCLQTLPLVS